jgi:hypothetical protein
VAGDLLSYEFTLSYSDSSAIEGSVDTEKIIKAGNVITNTGAPTDVTLVVASYDADGMLLNIAYQTETLETDETERFYC